MHPLPADCPLLRRITPAHVKIVDSAESTARVVRGQLLEDPPRGEAQLSSNHPGAASSDHRTFRFFVTDSVEKFKRLATGFLGRRVDRVEHVDLGG